MHALLCGPDMPTVAVVDFEVPLPDDPWAVRTDAFDFSAFGRCAAATYRCRCGHGARPTQDPAACCGRSRARRSR